MSIVWFSMKCLGTLAVLVQEVCLVLGESSGSAVFQTNPAPLDLTDNSFQTISWVSISFPTGKHLESQLKLFLCQ